MSSVPLEISSGRRSPAPRWRSTLLGSAGMFLALALLVRFAGVLPGEQLVYDAIVGWVTPTGVAIFKMIKTLGAWQFLLPATLLLKIGRASCRERGYISEGGGALPGTSMPSHERSLVQRML